MTEKRTVAIVGGGITGLSAAYYLQKKVAEKQLPVTYTLFEAANRLGGKIETAKHDGYIIERGPDSFLARKPELVELAKELGIADRLVHNATGRAYIYVDGRLHAIPTGSIMGIPTDQEAFMASDLFSDAGKKRALEDLTLSKSPAGQDQAMGQFFRRRLGDELVDRLIEPLLSGVYGGKLDEMSLMATYPQFYEVEQRYGSLIRGMKEQNIATAKKVPAKAGSQGAFYNFNTGLQTLIDALQKTIPFDKIRLSTSVTAFEKRTEGYQLTLSTGERVIYDAVIFTTPHQLTERLLRETGTMASFVAIPSTSVVTISMAFNAAAVHNENDGTGFLVSRKEKDFSITACTWISKKWAHSTPKGKAVIRCFLGRPDDEDYVNWSDEAITETALADLRKIMKIDADPEFVEITRIKDGMPHYRVGHKERVAAVRAALSEKLPLVSVAGLSYDGIGLSDCVRQGRTAGEEAAEGLAHLLNDKVK